MAVVLIEGFDHMTTAQVTSKGWGASPVSMQPGRLAGQCARANATNNVTLEIAKILPSSYVTAIVGVAHRFGNFNGMEFLRLKTGATPVARVRVNITSHKLEVLNNAGTVIATGSTVLATNTWYYVELKVFVNGASGTCEVHLNGNAATPEIASTVGNFGSTNIDTVSFGMLTTDSSNLPYDWDDMYVADTSGAAPRNTFLGDVRVSTIMPNADGAHTQWTPDTGTAHFSRVNETTPDGDTSFVSDATVGDLDTLKVASLPSLGGTVFAVQTNLYARKDDAAVRQIAPVVRQAATDNVGATVTLGTTYQFFTEIRNQDPTPADWTISNVNNDEYGVKVIA